MNDVVMNNVMTSIVENFISVFKATDDILNEWSGEGNLQFPALLGMIAVRLNWDEKQLRENDPFVRHYVRNHPDWHVTRGAHGGIMRSADKQKKDALKLQKELIKNQMQAEIDAKVMAATPPSVNDSEDDSDSLE